MPKNLPVWVYEWAALLREGVVLGLRRGIDAALIILAATAIIGDLL
jgi:hypothetical protein